MAEPEITRQGDAIVVQLPGVKNRDRALELVGQTAELRFRPVMQDLSGLADAAAEDEGDATTTTTAPADAATTTTAPTETTAPAEAAAGLVEGESASAPLQEPTTTTTAPVTPPTTAPAPVTDPSQIEPTPREQDAADATVILPGLDDGSLYQLGPTLATGRIVKTANADIQNGQWLVALEMRGGDDGIDKFNEIAAKCYDQAPDPQVCPSGRLAIVLDAVVQSAPSINEPSYEADQISISGSFSESEAKNLALVLRYGALPVELERQSVQTVSATLGEDSLRAGIIAGFVGLGLVALYMVLYYRALGAVVIVGLTVWGSLLYTIVELPGRGAGAGAHPRRRHRHHRVDRRDRRLLRRVLRAPEGRGARPGGRCAARPSGRSSGPSARSWPPTRRPSSAPPCCGG